MDFATRSFVELGGDSLGAMHLAALADEWLGVRIQVRALLGEGPLMSVLGSAAAVVPVTQNADPTSGQDGDQHDEPADDFASHAQLGMWLTEQASGGVPYNLVFICFVEQGHLEPALLRQAIGEIIVRHDGLRSVFRQRHGDVVREVLAAAEPEFTAVGYDGTDEDFEGHARRAAVEFGREPFDVSALPALRFLLLSRTPAVSRRSGHQAVILSAHHMMLDGLAVGLLLREVFTRYSELETGTPNVAVPGPGVAMQTLFQHQNALRASGEWDRQAELWGERMEGVLPVLELPSDRPRPGVRDTSGTRIPVQLDHAASSSAADRALELGITPFAFLLAAFGLTVSRWTGARSLLVGIPLIGRGTSELMRLIAYAGNLVPVRIDIDDGETAADYLRSVQRSLVSSIEAGDLPFAELVTRLGIERSPGSHPLVQVCFGMHDQLVPERITTDSVQVRVEEGHGGGSQFDLSVMISRSQPSFAGYAEYTTSVWSAAEAEGFVADFLAAAEQLAAATSPAAARTLLQEVRCMPDHRRALLAGINQTSCDFPATSLDELFRQAARRWPQAVAVRDAGAELTFGQLAQAAAEQARLLRAAGVGAGDRVLIGVERSVAEAVAILGTVWAGGAYIGIDLSMPPAHIAKLVARSTPAAAIAGPENARHLARYGINVVPAWDPAWPAGLEETPLAARDNGRLAYVAFTSGSTGEPRGVAVPHRAVIRLVHEAGYVRLGPGEHMLRLSPLAFDASTLELWGSLLTGTTLEVCPPGLLSPGELGAFLTERRVSVGWLTAGLFRLMEEFAPAALGSLRQLLTGGDVVPYEHVARALRRHPGLVITNGYGPTENTTFTTVYSVRRPEDVTGPLPIGTPVDGTRVYVLDDRARQIPPGAVGELYVGGEGLADGYLGDPAATARHFGYFSPDVDERLYRTGDTVRLDSRGRLQFLGRADDQVKVRGFRIEPDAIGAVLTAHPDVHDAVVAVTEGDSTDKRLMAAVVLVPGSAVTAADLRGSLSDQLPSYMVPALWALVDRIPVTANGKVDRRALAALAMPAALPARDPEASGMHALALALFAEAIDPASPDAGSGLAGESDFFMAGGSSMAAVRLVALVKERLGVTLRLRDFLLSPTADTLCRLIQKTQSAATAGAP
jgi:amino acid adenylation domain-containing protein